MNGWNGCDLQLCYLVQFILQELVNIFSRLLQQITVVEIVVLFISVMFLKFSQTSEYSERIQKMK